MPKNTFCCLRHQAKLINQFRPRQAIGMLPSYFQDQRRRCLIVWFKEIWWSIRDWLASLCKTINYLHGVVKLATLLNQPPLRQALHRRIVSLRAFSQPIAQNGLL